MKSNQFGSVVSMVKAMKEAGFEYSESTGLFRNAKQMYIGTISGNGYVKISFKGSTEYAHRLAWAWMTSEEPEVVDHIDGSKMNNRFKNLRNGTTRENCQNKRRHREGKLIGVCAMKNGSFKSQIRIGKRVICLGYFFTAEQAHEAYMNALPFVELYRSNAQFRVAVLSAAAATTSDTVFLEIGMNIFKRQMKNA